MSEGFQTRPTLAAQAIDALEEAKEAIQKKLEEQDCRRQQREEDLTGTGRTPRSPRPRISAQRTGTIP